MKVVHFSQDFRLGKPQLGGYSRILNQTKDGNEHVIFTIGNEYSVYKISNLIGKEVVIYQVSLKNINCYSFLNQFINGPIIILQILKILKKDNINPNIFIGHAQLYNFWILLIVKKLCFNRVRLIWEFNVIWGFDSGKGFKHRVRLVWQKFSQGLIVKLADGLIFQTVGSQTFITNRYKLRKSLKSVVIENSVDVKKFENISINTNIKAILVYGLFDKLNGIDFLINTLNQSQDKEVPEFHFLGNGPLSGMVELFCLNNPRHKFLGAIEKSEIETFLSNYQFGLIPRIDTLGSKLYIPTKVVEMINLGLIVIGSNVEGLSEVIFDGKNGFLYEEGNSEELLKTCKKALGLNNMEIEKMIKFGLLTLNDKFDLNKKLLVQNNFFRELI